MPPTEITSPLAATVAHVVVLPGQAIEAGVTVLFLEELLARTPADGLVTGTGTVNAHLVGPDRARPSSCSPGCRARCRWLPSSTVGASPATPPWRAPPTSSLPRRGRAWAWPGRP